MSIFAGLGLSDKTTHVCVVEAHCAVLRRDAVATVPMCRPSGWASIVRTSSDPAGDRFAIYVPVSRPYRVRCTRSTSVRVISNRGCRHGSTSPMLTTPKAWRNCAEPVGSSLCI